MPYQNQEKGPGIAEESISVQKNGAKDLLREAKSVVLLRMPERLDVPAKDKYQS